MILHIYQIETDTNTKTTKVSVNVFIESSGVEVLKGSYRFVLPTFHEVLDEELINYEVRQILSTLPEFQ